MSFFWQGSYKCRFYIFAELCKKTGEKAAETFIECRLVDKITPFQAPLKKQNLSIFHLPLPNIRSALVRRNIFQIKAERNVF